MSKKSKIFFDQIPELPGLESLFQAVDRAFKKFGIDYFLIGAFAKDIWIAYLQEAPNPVRTKDIDFASRITDREQFLKVKRYLMEEEGFEANTQNNFVLHSPDGIQIDLLPFGSEEDESLVAFHGTGKTEFSTQGFEEVFSDAKTITIGTSDYKVCSPPGLVILKLIAWQDRPELRSKDLQDIHQILLAYEEVLEEEDIFDHNAEVLADYDEEGKLYMQRVCARIMGRQMGKILLNGAPALQQRIIALLSSAAQDEKSVLIRKLGEEDSEMPLANLRKLIEDIIRGIKESFSKTEPGEK